MNFPLLSHAFSLGPNKPCTSFSTFAFLLLKKKEKSLQTKGTTQKELIFNRGGTSMLSLVFWCMYSYQIICTMKHINISSCTASSFRLNFCTHEQMKNCFFLANTDSIPSWVSWNYITKADLKNWTSTFQYDLRATIWLYQLELNSFKFVQKVPPLGRRWENVLDTTSSAR